MNFLTEEAFIEITQEYGYCGSDEQHEIYQLVLRHMEVEIRDAIKVAMIDADNHDSITLRASNIVAVKKHMKIFPAQKK